MAEHAKIRREITRWCEQQMNKQGIDGWYLIDRNGWSQCPLVNPLCPSDLCILPAGHTGTIEGYHVLGTTAYSAAEKFPLEWMMPGRISSSPKVLIKEGWRRQKVMFPDGD